ncbi:MAG TPA: DMT family transporter [Methylomirabilota bacterium]|nr:DMT family transporter [Methylomirabilota bacterium]
MAGDPSAVGSVALGLASAASWGAGDFAGGLASRRAPALGVVVASQAVGIALLVVLSTVTAEAAPSVRQVLWAALAGANGALGLFALYSALASGRMGIAAPVSGVVGALVPVLAGSLVHGPPRPIRLAGFGLAVAGVWLLTAANLDASRAGLRELGLPVLAGVSFGLFLVFIHRAGPAVLLPLIVARVTSMGVLAAIGGAAGTLTLPARSALGLTCLAGVLDTGGNAFFALAAQTGRLDVAGVLSSLYPASTVALACLLLGERLTRRQVAGAIATLAAIALVSW